MENRAKSLTATVYNLLTSLQAVATLPRKSKSDFSYSRV